MEAMISALGPWGLNTTGVDNHQAQPLGQGIDSGRGASAEASLSPTDRRHASAPPPLGPYKTMQGRKDACHLTQGFVQATI